MKISILTAFPGMIKNYLETSILGKGIAKGIFDVEVIDIRDFAQGNYKQIDDYCYGKGGMILMPEPLKKALEHLSRETKPYVVYPSPQGVTLHQEIVEDLARKENIAILCGHYEGVDERFTEKYVDLEVSLGDFVLTGGEMPAMALVDAISRLIPGVVGKTEAVQEDSFYNGMLDHPNYTRPAVWDDEEVPEILLSGNDTIIKEWRRRQSVERTLKRRPDIIGRAGIMPYLNYGAYVIEIYNSTLDPKTDNSISEGLKLNLIDTATVCRTYGIERYILIAPNAQQRETIKQTISLLSEEAECKDRPDLKEALNNIKLFGSTQKALAWIEKRSKTDLHKVVVTTKDCKKAVNWLSLKREILLKNYCTVFIFGRECELHSKMIDSANTVLPPISGVKNNLNHLSVRSTIGITLDRFFGQR
mgnify:CR=1 FL=1